MAKNRLLLTLATMIGTMIGLGCRTTPITTGLAEADRDAIRQLSVIFIKMATAKPRDNKAAAAIYSNDAILWAPAQPPIEGRAAIEAFLASWPPFTDYKLEALEIDGQGTWAYERGTASMTLTPQDAPPTPVSMKYLIIYRKQPDGAWLAVREIMTPDAAPEAPGKPAPSGP